MLPAAALLSGVGAEAATPAGAPSGGFLYRHSGSKIGVGWVNGDATSSTRVYYVQTENPSNCPSTFPDDLTLVDTASPGAVTLDTTDEDTIEQCSYYVVHFKGGAFSSWHQVVDKLDAGSCLGC